jgi:hypothetical protein
MTTGSLSLVKLCLYFGRLWNNENKIRNFENNEC